MFVHQGETVSLNRSVLRDPLRRELVASITNAVDGLSIDGLLYGHDALGRPVSRNADTFGYNACVEVISSRRATENAEDSYSYDDIGNLTHFSSDAITNAYSANCLNQYVSISGVASRPGEPNVATTPSSMLAYDLDGNLVSDGVSRYSYDAENRLVAMRSASLTNGAVRVLNSYDHNHRRVRKTVQRLMLPASVPPAPPQSGEWTTTETHAFFYDDWNLIEERISRDDGTDFTNRYVRGKDLSGSLQDAGGVGGLLAVIRDGVPYFPTYDNNGNITRYLDASGASVAAYTYDAFGRTVTATGPLADVFPHRFSTKYFDPETGLYYYGYRYYSPTLMRWLNRDPIEEEGGLNLYSLCSNNPLYSFDPFGMDRYITWFDILGLGGSGQTHLHVGVAVDTWKCSNGKWEKDGILTFDFRPKFSFINILLTPIAAKGTIDMSYGLNLENPIKVHSSPEQDMAMLEKVMADKQDPPLYNVYLNNCSFLAVRAINYGMQNEKK